MRIFKTKPFSRFAERNSIPDTALCGAARRAEAGLIDADLGGGVIKQRVARDRSGAAGGFRTIALFRRGQRTVFVYGFAKKERDNIRRDELVAFRKLADTMLALDDAEIGHALANGTVTEVHCDD